MATKKEQQLYGDRLKKLEQLRTLGIDPYPPKSLRTHSIGEVLRKFSKTARGRKQLVLAGRLRALRAHGGLVFSSLEDGTGLIQLMISEGELGKRKFERLQKLVDLGDFLEVGGHLVKTKRGEKTVFVSDYRILAKSLRALPEKWHGLVDTETRLRRRYLDLIINPQTKELFRKKAKFWRAVREYLEDHGFMEVDTPALEDVPGGADARPFITHHQALDRDFYLRISLELPLKKLIVGGFEKVYEIGKVFRNEGISSEHLQDFLACEFYWAYADYEKMMELVEELYKFIVKQTAGALKTQFQGQQINWGSHWPRTDYFTLIKKQLKGLPLEKTSDERLRMAARRFNLEIPKEWKRGRIIDEIFKKAVRPKLVQPVLVVNHPLEVSPLAKKHPKLPGRVERFVVIAGGTELGNGYSELNDPLDQEVRFQEQMNLRKAGDEEAQMMDESFIEALEYGMPPTAGFGLSERLFAVLMNKSVRETVIFPPMKAK